MKKHILLLSLALLLPLTVHAQWRVGVTGGASYNLFSLNKQYMTDYQIDGQWGATAGITGQYNLVDWLAVRAELNLTQKNYRKYRVLLSQMDYRYQNDYLQLPVMASLSAGGRNLRGFCNLGVYGGYWLNSYREGRDFNNFGGYSQPVSENVAFLPQVDQRWDFGFLGGLGMECRIAAHWCVQAEVRCYYSTVSTVKQYMRVKDYRYNTTAAIQLGISYIF